MKKGFLVDKFGKYKPVVILTLLLNALFHHALFIIPQQEIPGQMPSAFVMRHPNSGNVEVWWSPCPSRECPQAEEIYIVVNSCQDYCLLLEQNPKIEPLPHSPTKYPGTRNDELFDLNPEINSKKKTRDSNLTMNFDSGNWTAENRSSFDRENWKESWVGDGEALKNSDNN